MADRKAIANRNNAKRSTGPKSVLGKERSRSNALRHGLAVDVCADPELAADLERLAKILSEAAGEEEVSDQARLAAAAELDLLRIRRVQATMAGELQSETRPGNSADLHAKFAALERYEKRAYSRRRRAFREMIGSSPA